MNKKAKMKSNINNRLQRTTIGQTFEMIKYFYSRNNHLLIGQAIIVLILCFILVGRALEYKLVNQRILTEVTWIDAFPVGVMYGKVYTLFIYLILEFIVFKIVSQNYKPYILDVERRFGMSDTQEAGSSHFMTEEEEEKTFTVGNIKNQTGNILGTDETFKDMYAILPQYGINANALYIGSPGSGKTRCLGMPMILQTIRRGESMFVTDPKGELYGYTAELAKAHGYTVKILNLDPQELVNSDSFDFMSVIGNDELKANVFANTLISNTVDTGKNNKGNFWEDGALNLCKGCVLAINSGIDGIPKTLGGLFQLLSTNTPDQLETIFENLPSNHPARNFFNIYANGDKTVKGNTLNGLAIKLSILGNNTIKRVTGTPDIDLTLPGKEKCLYFISMSDQEDTLNFLVALFFSLMFQELVAFANKQPDKKLPITVWLLLDELFSIGKIPGFDKKLSNIRSRGINTTMIVQDLTQLQTLFPDNGHETIINCCSVVALLETGAAPSTAEFFSKRCGVATVVTQSKRYNDAPSRFLKVLDNGMQVTEQKTGRPLMTPDEVQTMDPLDILITVATKPCIKLKKYDFANHPMTKEIVPTLSSEHVPKWYLNMTEAERQEENIKEIPYDGTVWDGSTVTLCTEEDYKHPAAGKTKKNSFLFKNLLEGVVFGLSSTDDDYTDDDEDDDYKESNSSDSKESISDAFSLISEDRDELDEHSDLKYQNDEQESEVIEMDDSENSAQNFAEMFGN